MKRVGGKPERRDGVFVWVPSIFDIVFRVEKFL